MNKLKKGLIGTAIAGTLVAAAGAGTYAWFTADYEATGTITNHTLTINEEFSATETLDFGDEMLAPSRILSDTLTFKNTGSLDQILRLNADLALYDGNKNVGVPDKSAYKATATVFYNGTEVGSKTGNVQEIDNYLESEGWLPNNDGKGNFPEGAEVQVKLDVELLKTAGNEYQGKTLKGEVRVEARQTDEGSKFLGEE